MHLPVITCTRVALAAEAAAASPRVPGEAAVGPIAYWVVAEYPA